MLSIIHHDVDTSSNVKCSVGSRVPVLFGLINLKPIMKSHMCTMHVHLVMHGLQETYRSSWETFHPHTTWHLHSFHVSCRNQEFLDLNGHGLVPPVLVEHLIDT